MACLMAKVEYTTVIVVLHSKKALITRGNLLMVTDGQVEVRGIRHQAIHGMVTEREWIVKVTSIQVSGFLATQRKSLMNYGMKSINRTFPPKIILNHSISLSCDAMTDL